MKVPLRKLQTSSTLAELQPKLPRQSMAPTFRVVDLRNSDDPKETIVEGASAPEEAVAQALGIEVTRGAHPRNLVAKVYWVNSKNINTVMRFYRRPTS
jgi:hypothetical protein